MNPLRKFMAGQRIDTLGATREQVKGGRYQGGAGGGDVSQVIQDLNGIEEYFQNSDTVYVASSVIIKWAKEGGGDRDQARLIDLAHPIRKGKASDEVFQAAREGMLLGIRNVRNLLLGGNLEERGESKLPIGVGNLETKTPGGEQPNAPGGQAAAPAPAAPAQASDNPLEAMFLQAPAQGKEGRGIGAHRRPSFFGRHRRNATKGAAPALEGLVTGGAEEASASAQTGATVPTPPAAPAPAPKTAPAPDPVQPEAASAEPDVEELKRMAQAGQTLTISQRRRIYGG